MKVRKAILEYLSTQVVRARASASSAPTQEIIEAVLQKNHVTDDSVRKALIRQIIGPNAIPAKRTQAIQTPRSSGSETWCGQDDDEDDG
jgi:hypothetical protein